MEAARVITIDDPELGGTYEVHALEGGRLLLEPRLTTLAEIEARHNLRRLTSEEFAGEFGDLPRDGEG